MIRPLIIVILITSSLNAQKHDNVWTLGQDGFDSVNLIGGCHLIFGDDSLQIPFVGREADFIWTASSFSDSSGQLMYYTNGCYISDSDHKRVKGGDSLNYPSFFYSRHCTREFSDGYTEQNGAMFLNFRDSDSLFLIHLTEERVNKPEWMDETKGLYLTIIAKYKDNETAEVVLKNHLLIEGPLAQGNIVSTLHANGKDWWIVVRKKNSDEYHKILLGRGGVKERIDQKIGPTRNARDHPREATMSPDGTLLAEYCSTDGFHLMKFDRCTGELSEPITFNIPVHPDSAYTAGVEFSPDNRFIYVCSPFFLFQMDLHTPDLEASLEIIGQWDGSASPFGTVFYLMELGPDGRIYMNCPNSNDVLHTILEPNKKGVAANFVQRHVQLPVLNGFQLPQFPNYRLGKLEDSDCMTSSDDVIKNENILLYPSPFTTELKIRVDEGSFTPWSIQFFDALGREVLKEDVNTHGETLIQGLRYHPPGILFYRITDRLNQVVKSGKVVKQ